VGEEVAEEDDDEPLDPEGKSCPWKSIVVFTHQILSRLVDKEKHEGFKQKRKGHYSNEAEAMRLAQALMAQETPEDEAGEQ
jgi:hypothetical protein